MLDGFSRGLILFFAVSLAVVSARAASFTASLDRDTITLGETATLSLKFEGGSPEQQLPSSLTVSNLQLVLVGGPSHFDININGNATSYDTYTYVVTPTQAGEFTIPAMTAKIGGQMLTSQPLKLTVTAPGAPVAAGANPGSQLAFARLALPQQPVYVGETITADLQLFYRQEAQLAQRPQLTAMPADGFAVGRVVGDNQTLTQVGNALYNVIPAKIPLTADKTGALRFGPVTIGLVLLVESSDRQSDPSMGSFPFGFFGRTVQKNISVATEALDVKSLPLPAENVPANFTGAVGDYTLTVTAGPTNVTVGDPITVRVQIAGRGAIDTLKLPDQAGWDDFKIFPPTSKVETSDPLAIEGTKTFEEIVTPQTADVRDPAGDFLLLFQSRRWAISHAHTASRAAGRSFRRGHAAAGVGGEQKRRAGKSDAAGHFADQGRTGNARAGGRAARHAARLSRRPIAACAGVSRRVGLAQTRGQSRQQSASAPPARRGATRRRRHGGLETICGGEPAG